jgi:hypothetical protein
MDEEKGLINVRQKLIFFIKYCVNGIKICCRKNKENINKFFSQLIPLIGVFGSIFAIYQGIVAMRISEKNYKITSEQFVLSNRPYLHAILEPYFGRGSGSEHEIWFGGGNLYLKNAGAIPASIINADYHVISDELPNIDLMGWFEKDRGGFPYVKAVFQGSESRIPLHPIIGKTPKLLFVSAIITYTGVNPNKIYWYKFNRLYYIKELPIETNPKISLEILKAEEDWDRNNNFIVPKFEKPDWAFYLKSR